MSFNKKIVVLILVAILLILSIVGLTLYVVKNKNTKNNETPTEIIADTTAPIIILDDNYVVKTGYNGNLVNSIMSADDIDPNPKREILGQYNLNVAGEYSLTYKITDASGNIATKDFILKVRDNYTTSQSSIAFEDAVTKYKNNNTRIGIDVSKWQENIDWVKMKEQGVEFAVIRMGYQKGFDEEVAIDPYFKQNIEGCLNNGISVAIYFSSYAKTEEEAKNQALWIRDNIGYNYVNLSVAFDWENWSSFNSLKMSLTDINNIANSFMNECQNIGFKPMLYGSKKYLESVWNNSNNYPVWLAHYTEKTNYSGSYKIWQISETGIIDGITGYVDIDVMY